MDKWSLDELVYGVPTDGPYQTNPPSPDDIILSIRIDREVQVCRIRHEEEIDVLEYQVLTREIEPTLNPLEEIIRENVFCLGVLSKKDLKGTRIEHGFKRAFLSLFGQDNKTFTSTMLLNIDELQKQLDKDEFQEDGSMEAFWVINRQFQMFIDSQFTLDYDSQMTDKYFAEYTEIEDKQFRETLLQCMSDVKKSVAERMRHKRLYDRRVNKKKMLKQESKVNSGKALDAGLVVTESIGTKSEVQDESSRSGNDADVADADIRPIYDEEPMADVQLSAEHRFSPNKTSAVYEKTTPRSDLRWKPTGRIFDTVGLKWISIGKLLDSCTGKVDSESPHGSNVDISKIHECKQTLDLSAGTSINGDLRMLFDPDEKDKLWMNQLDWKLLKWKLQENYRVHTLFMDGTPMDINMLVEKKYPLIKELLEKVLNLQLEAEEESTMAFELIKFIKSMLEEYQMTDKYFPEYIEIEDKQFRETLLQRASDVKKSVAERTRHKRLYDRRVNKKQMLKQESKVNSGKALDAGLVVTESSGTKSEVQDENSRSGIDTDVANADIRPIYDEEPMAEVQLSAECNIFAIGQQHTKQPEFNNEGGIDQYTEKCQVKSPMLNSSLDNKTIEFSNQSLESENICNMVKFLNETSNKAKIKKEIDVLEIINIELKHSVAKLLKENETLKKHYKDLYDSIKLTRSKTIEQTTSLLANNADLKAQIQEKIFTVNRFSPNQTFVVYEKTTPRSDLRWKPTGRIFDIVGLKWILIGKLLDSCTSKVDSESPHGTSYNVKKENLRVWLLKRMISQKQCYEGFTTDQKTMAFEQHGSSLAP
ncbi:hypothetical protein Tco_1408374 [Tanacetum coccineum]